MEDKEIDYIIPPEDPRYKSLNLIFNKFRLEDLVDGEGGSTYYYILPELMVNEYETGCTRVVFNPRSKDDTYDNWVNKRNITRLLAHTCGLTVQEYYDLIELHINNRLDRPKCEICGEYLRSTNRLSSGYIGFFGEHRFCSHSCTASYYNLYEGNSFCSFDDGDLTFLAKSQAKAVMQRSYRQFENEINLYFIY